MTSSPLPGPESPRSVIDRAPEASHQAGKESKANLAKLIPINPSKQSLLQQVTQQYIAMGCPCERLVERNRITDRFALVKGEGETTYLDTTGTSGNPPDTNNDEAFALALQALEIAQYKYDQIHKSKKQKTDIQSFFHTQTQDIISKVNQKTGSGTALGADDCRLLNQHKRVQHTPKQLLPKPASHTQFSGNLNIGNTCYINAAVSAMAGYGSSIIQSIDQQMAKNTESNTLSAESKGTQNALLDCLKQRITHILPGDAEMDEHAQTLNMENLMANYNALDPQLRGSGALVLGEQMEAVMDFASPVLSSVLPDFLPQDSIQVTDDRNTRITLEGGLIPVKIAKHGQAAPPKHVQLSALINDYLKDTHSQDGTRATRSLRNPAPDHLVIRIDRVFKNTQSDGTPGYYNCDTQVRLPPNGILQVDNQSYKIVSLILHHSSSTHAGHGASVGAGHYTAFIPDPNKTELVEGTHLNDLSSQPLEGQTKVKKMQNLGGTVAGVMLRKTNPRQPAS